MDLSKTYDCLPHDLIVKLAAYGFDKTALVFSTNSLQTVFNG